MIDMIDMIDMIGKRQVIISITGSCDDSSGLAEWSALLPPGARLALPHYFVGRDGTVEACKGLAEATEWLGGRDESRVHVALCNAGPLRRSGDRFFSAAGEAVLHFYEFCTQSPYRGHVYYELITPKQIAALEGLCRELIGRLGIQYRYDATLGSLSPRCLGGEAGVWLASGLVKGRIDPHPQTELIKMMMRLTDTAAENGC